jgi:hypothetical protein
LAEENILLPRGRTPDRLISMKTEYVEGPEALENFKRLATAILQAPAKKKKRQTKKSASEKKPQKSDRD